MQGAFQASLAELIAEGYRQATEHQRHTRAMLRVATSGVAEDVRYHEAMEQLATLREAACDAELPRHQEAMRKLTAAHAAEQRRHQEALIAREVPWAAAQRRHEGAMLELAEEQSAERRWHEDAELRLEAEQAAELRRHEQAVRLPTAALAGALQERLPLVSYQAPGFNA